MKLAFKHLIVAGLLSLGFSGSASAATTLFTDNFESYALGTPTPGALSPTWTVLPGTVDVIGPGNGYNWYGPGKYVDLNGTPDSAAQITTNQKFNLVAGKYYELTFDYGLNKNSGPDEGLQFGVGNNFSSFSILATPVTLITYVFGFVAQTSGAFSIFFKDLNLTSGDLGGPILDNVKFAVVPLPAAGLLLGGALAGLALFGRLRRKPEAA